MYLDRGIRTVQRWERDLGLPVHRVGNGPRSPVHAFPAELQAWLLRTGRPAEIAPLDGHGKVLMHPNGTVATSRVLVNRSSSLVKQLVHSLWIQQQRAQELVRIMEDVRGRLHRQLQENESLLDRKVRRRPERKVN